jgi:hypothetical protein
MDYSQLYKFLTENKKIKKEFNGIVFIDQLRKIPVQKGFYVLNTDSEKGKGFHWCVLEITEENSQNEFFDSFGREPNRFEILNFFRKNGSSIKYSSKQLQSSFNFTCGNWCCLFIYCRVNGISMEKFLQFFNYELKLNDAIMEKIFKQIFSTS